MVIGSAKIGFRTGGEGGIRTPDRGVSPYNGLANRRLQPLGHLSGVFAASRIVSVYGHLQQLPLALLPLLSSTVVLTAGMTGKFQAASFLQDIEADRTNMQSTKRVLR